MSHFPYISLALPAHLRPTHHVYRGGRCRQSPPEAAGEFDSHTPHQRFAPHPHFPSHIHTYIHRLAHTFAACSHPERDCVLTGVQFYNVLHLHAEPSLLGLQTKSRRYPTPTPIPTTLSPSGSFLFHSLIPRPVATTPVPYPCRGAGPRHEPPHAPLLRFRRVHRRPHTNATRPPHSHTPPTFQPPGDAAVVGRRIDGPACCGSSRAEQRGSRAIWVEVRLRERQCRAAVP